jgi:hypothetical protein
MGSEIRPGRSKGIGLRPRVWERRPLRTMVESSRVSRVSEGEMYRRFHSVAGT